MLPFHPFTALCFVISVLYPRQVFFESDWYVVDADVDGDDGDVDSLGGVDEQAEIEE